MKHFGLEEWVDFSRDLIPEKRKKLMQQHLETGAPIAEVSLKPGNASTRWDASIPAMSRPRVFFGP